MAGLVGQMLNQYRLIEQVGQGGMATVFRAVDTKQMDEVAVKVLSPTISGDRRFVLRFRREAGLVKQRLNHPNIVPVMDYGEDRGFIYLVMPFLSGLTLHDHLVQRRITERERAHWIGQVAEALAFAHDQGVIHRDIKPSNIMITDEGDALLMDFGLAREIEGSNTLTGSMLMGTPAFIAPEQGRGQKLDHRSDQYSLGVILYYLATGRLPFESASPMATVMQHIQEPVPRPGRFNPDLSKAEERVIIKTLAKRRDDRFEDCHQLNQSYQAAIAGKKMPEFDLPPPAPTMSVARREVPTIAEALVEAPDLPQKRVAWWVIPVVILAVIMVGVFAFPSLSGLMGWSTPTSSPVTLVPPTATSFVIIGATPSEPAISATPVVPLTAASCPGIVLHPPSTEGNTVRWMVDNGSETTVEVIRLQLEGWPLGNGGLEQFWMNDQLLWEGEYKAGQEVELAGEGDLFVGTNTPAIFAFKFHWGAASAGYQLRVVFDAGCTLQGSW